VNVLIDGAKSGPTIDLYSRTQHWQVFEHFGVTGPGPQHTIEIKPAGTKNAKSSGKAVMLDAFRASVPSGSGEGQSLNVNSTNRTTYLLLLLSALVGALVRRRA
jgi:hypothetical protein